MGVPDEYFYHQGKVLRMDQDDPSDGSRRTARSEICPKPYSPLSFGRWIKTIHAMDQDGSARTWPRAAVIFVYRGRVLSVDLDDPSDGSRRIGQEGVASNPIARYSLCDGSKRSMRWIKMDQRGPSAMGRSAIKPTREAPQNGASGGDEYSGPHCTVGDVIPRRSPPKLGLWGEGEWGKGFGGGGC